MIQCRLSYKFLGLLAGAAGLIASPLSASADGWYVGGGIGQSKVDAVECEPDPDIACSADDSDTAFKVFGGYQFASPASSPFTGAVEFGYVDLGEASITASDSSAAARIVLEGSGFTFSVLGSLAATDWLSLIGKVGVMRWDYDVDVSVATVLGSGFGSGSDSGTDIMFGFGAGFAMTEQFGARLEWERFDIDGDDVDLMSASFIYRF